MSVSVTGQKLHTHCVNCQQGQLIVWPSVLGSNLLSFQVPATINEDAEMQNVQEIVSAGPNFSFKDL